MKALCQSLVLAILAARVSAADDSWGNLSLRFTYDGQPPRPEKILVDKDKEYCGKKELLAESLVVNAQDRGVANVVVWLDAQPRQALSVHPSYEAPAKKDAVMAFEKCRLSPHIALVRTIQPFKLVSRDDVAHAPALDFFNNPAAANSIALSPGFGEIKRTFQEAEVSPSRVQCAIHTWITGYVLIRDNPYMALSDSSGKLTIAVLPVGKHTFRVWQESAGFVKAASRGGKPVEWPRARVEIEIKPGENDLGEIKLSPAIFRK